MTQPPRPRQFGSDNYSGICPEAIEALLAANAGHEPAYGNDRYSREATEATRAVFETDCDVFSVYNGTAANCMALAAICEPYHAIIAHEFGHTYSDECNGPEFFTGGSRLLLASGRDGKLTPAAIEHLATARGDVHFARVRAVTFAQATEAGTVYQPHEIAALCETAHRLGLKVHMDGARLANAAAHLGVPPADFTWRAGVDVLSFGLTKNGLAVGESVVFFDRELGREFEFRRKQAGQLASKMRFLAAPWAAMLRTGTWLRNAAHANRCARELEHILRAIPGSEILFPVQANAIFVRLAAETAEALRARGWLFHHYPAAGGYRFMCSWDTRQEDIQTLAADLRAITSEPDAPG